MRVMALSSCVCNTQVFDAFLHSFTTYRPLLMRVKSEYDAALDDALSSLYDNVHMKAQLAAFQKRLVSQTDCHVCVLMSIHPLRVSRNKICA